jgi:hypothetical protein
VNLVDELHSVAAALEGEGIPYAVCGGIAVTIHGATRTTKDIDLLVKRGDVARILDLLRPLGYRFAALPMTFDAGTPRERHVQRVSKMESGEHLVIDLMLEEGALAGFSEGALSVRLPRGNLRVVSRGSLLAMKRLAGRSQDLADIERLERDDGD